MFVPVVPVVPFRWDMAMNYNACEFLHSLFQESDAEIPEAYQEDYLERVAILEVDGGLDHDSARVQAVEEIWKRRPI